MPKIVSSKQYLPFIKGLFTEASMVNFPEGATIDEDNFYLTRLGIRERRLGLNLDQDGVWVVPVGNYTECSKPSLCNPGTVIPTGESYCDNIRLYIKGNNFTDGGSGDIVGGDVVLGFNGSTTITTSSDTPFGTNSIDFPGNISPPSYGYITATQANNLTLLGSGDFTIDLHFKIKTGENYAGLFRCGVLYVQWITGQIRILDDLSVLILGGTLNQETWYHLRLSRASGNLTVYIDGVSIGNSFTSTDWSGDTCVLGYDGNAGALNGYLKCVRVLNGLALSTEGTPVTEEYPYNCS